VVPSGSVVALSPPPEQAAITTRATADSDERVNFW